MDEEVERCLREHAEKEAARGGKDGGAKDDGASDEVHASATPTETVN
jgi:hypothetical protein